jgi:hypothetical protein
METGETRLDEIRKYLDDENRSPRLEHEIASHDAPTFSGFDEWLESLGGDPNEDARLIQEYQNLSLQSPLAESKEPNPRSDDRSPAIGAFHRKTLLIVTDLQKPGSTGTFTEQLFVDANCEIREVLQTLKDKGE